jgi:ubiquinone/menaquinone biosynthesis C-methylase UbiE
MPFVRRQVNIIRIGQQLQNFQDYQQTLAEFVGEDAARQVVNNALVLITLGGNDFVNNYYLVPFSVRSRQFAIQDYVPYLISEYRKILTVNSFNSTQIPVTHACIKHKQISLNAKLFRDI